MLAKGNRGVAAKTARGAAPRAGCALLIAAALAAASAAIPAYGAGSLVMVPYDHPVFHNGHRVLYHGVWRNHASPGPKAQTPVEDKSAKAEPHEFIVWVDPDDATSLRMTTELVDSAVRAGLKARAWAGKTSPDDLRKMVEGDSGDFVVAPIVGLADDPQFADLRAKAPFVARLAAEPVTVIANANITDIKQLQGRPVAFGEAGGVAEATARALFAKLGVAPKVVNENVAAALASLDAGRIDAMALFGADESRALADAAKGGKLHALAVPWRDELQGYAPARLTARDLPNLVAAEASIETVSAPFGLLAIDAADGSARAAQDAPFVAALFERNQPLLGPNAAARWREVNFAADTDWPRLASAQAWVDKHRAASDSALDQFRATARSAASGAAAAAVADKLYVDLLRAKGAGP